MGRKVKDLTGNKFGRWTVLSMDGDGDKKTARTHYWLCRCECGTVRSVSGNTLKKHESLSCGCLQRERTKLPKNRSDLTGQKFGLLEVIKFSHVKNHETYFLCKCECGRTAYVRGSRLTGGTVISCGCKEKENKAKINDKIAPFLYDGTNIASIRSNKLSSANKSGVKGVHFNSRTGKWVGKITFKGKEHRYVSSDFESAVRWRKEMEEKLFAPAIKEFFE